MRTELKGDERVRKTLQRIHSAFHKLVQKKGYSELTVSAICSEAGIGRKTFYVYYESLDDLLRATLERMAKDYAFRLRDYNLPEDFSKITREFYIYSTEQGKFYDNLVCSESYQAIGAQLVMRFVRDTWNKSAWFNSLSDDEQEVLLCFIYNAGISLYRQWVISGRKINMNKMIEYANSFLANGINGFKNITLINTN